MKLSYTKYYVILLNISSPYNKFSDEGLQRKRSQSAKLIDQKQSESKRLIAPRKFRHHFAIIMTVMVLFYNDSTSSLTDWFHVILLCCGRLKRLIISFSHKNAETLASIS